MPSTAVRDIAYDEKSQTLWLTFVPTGHHYAYRGVPADVHASFRRAFSKGSFFNRHIRDHYPFQRVDHAEPNSATVPASYETTGTRG